jgi:L-asparaginase
MMRKICLIYTGGTIGMKQNPNGKLAPVDFDQLRASIPSLDLLPIQLEVNTVAHPVDSSEMQPEGWIDLVERIEANYDAFDGFVILHGTDTMAYTASALSFMIQGLKKPIIITGSQLPVGVLRTDATENLLSALEFAAMERDGVPLIQEVCIYFEYKLYRGNRAYKRSSNEFNAFSSPNYPALGESGVRMTVYEELLWKTPAHTATFQKSLDAAVGVVTLYPGLQFDQLPVLQDWKVLLLRTFGAGNAPNSPAFIEFLSRCEKSGVQIINTSQCVSGRIVPGLYDSSSAIERFNVLSASDMTFESALVKSMVLLGQGLSQNEFAVKFSTSIAGESA